MTPMELLKINVNEHTEKKNGLTYLSWAWAWAEALKADPKVTFKVEMFDGTPLMPVGGSYMVWVTVTMFDKPVTCMLPVLDYKNKPIATPNSFDVNTAIMRCLVKAIAMHGLGLYIYAGEDCPQGEEEESMLDVNAMIDYLAAIEAAPTMEDLKNVYIAAYAACDGDKGWQKKVMEAKEKRKGELK